MQGLISFTMLAVWAVCIFGLFRPLPFFRRRRRWALLTMVLATLGAGFLMNLTPEAKADLAKKQAWEREMAQMKAANPSSGDSRPVVLAEYHWSSECGGNCMSLSGVIQNQTGQDRKDPVITCRMFGDSRTELKAKERTLYKVVPAHGKLKFNAIEMGIISDQATNARCDVSGSSKF